MKARDVMSGSVATVGPDAPVGEIAALLLERRISGVPVVDAAGHLLGVVSEADLMWRAETDTVHRRGWWASLLGGRAMMAADFIRAYGRTARDVMTSPVITVTADEPLEAVISTMESHRIKRVPVVDGGRVVGIISRSDFLRSLANAPVDMPVRDDGAIRERLETLLDAQPWASLVAITIVVERGVVRLVGLVDSEAERRAYETAARSVSGVARVQNDLVLRNHSIAD